MVPFPGFGFYSEESRREPENTRGLWNCTSLNVTRVTSSGQEGTQRLAFGRKLHTAAVPQRRSVSLDVLGSCERGGGKRTKAARTPGHSLGSGLAVGCG